MMIHRSFIILVFLLLSQSVHANFDFNANCINAYQSILSLKLNQARTLILAEKKKNPGNSIPYLLDSYVDFFALHTSGSSADFERLKNNKSARLSRVEKEDPRSPYYLFAQAEINLQTALSRIRFNEYFTSALEINRALKQLEENSKKFPGFLPNQKGLGMINAVLGSVPAGLKKALSAFGIRGDTGRGLRMLENLIVKLPASPYPYFYEETVFYLANIKTDILRDPAYYNKIIAITNAIQDESLLRTYLRAHAGIKMGHNKQAIDELSERPSGPDYQPYPELDYLTGLAKIYNLDQSASANLLQYLKNYRGTNYIKDSYLNLAWLELLKGNVKGYQNFIDQLKQKGYLYHERDKQALREANDPMPDVRLLKARLLFDGAYYDRALNVLDEENVSDFGILRDKIEYYYRMGRIYDEISKDDLALKYYQAALDLGKNERYYFASNAALRMAVFYEKKRDVQKAKYYYNSAINMKDHDYENSIENRAKEGLKRLGD